MTTIIDELVEPDQHILYTAAAGNNAIDIFSDIQQLPQDDKAHLFALTDAFLRDHKAKKAYAS